MSSYVFEFFGYHENTCTVRSLHKLANLKTKKTQNTQTYKLKNLKT